MIIDISEHKKKKQPDIFKALMEAAEERRRQEIAAQIAHIAKTGIVKWEVDTYDDQTKREILLNGFRD